MMISNEDWRVFDQQDVERIQAGNLSVRRIALYC